MELINKYPPPFEDLNGPTDKDYITQVTAIVEDTIPDADSDTKQQVVDLITSRFMFVVDIEKIKKAAQDDIINMVNNQEQQATEINIKTNPK